MQTERHPPKIILIGTQMTRAGAQYSLLKLGRGLQARGWQVSAAFLYDKDGLQADWQAAEGFPVLDMGLWRKGGRWWDAWRLLVGWLRLLRLLRAGQFDLLMSFTQHCNLLAIPAAWLAGVPVRVASNRGCIDGMPPWMSRLHGAMVNSAATTCLVANSEHVRGAALEFEKVHPQKIVVIPNGVELPDLQGRETARRAVCAEFDLAPDANVLLSVGRLTRQKGHTYLLDALPDVLRAYPNTLLLAVGDGDLRQPLQEQARRLGLENAIRFTGMRADVPRLLLAADLFVFPTLWEGMPNALLEAMAYRLPCVASAIPEVQEVMVHGESGYLFPARQSAPLAQALITLLSDAALRQRLAQGSRAVVEKRYSVAGMWEAYAGLFEQLLSP